MKTSRNDSHDVAIIGGGVVGCAVARRFALGGARVVLIERGDDILSGASKANSAILHTGFDAPNDSLELACMRAGYAEYREIADRMNLPLLKTSAMVVAWNESDAQKLDGIVAHAHRNGIDNVVRIDREEVLSREPEMAGSALGGVLVPDEHVIDPWTAPLGYIQQAMAHGATVWRGATLLAGDFDGEQWRLQTSRGDITATEVINCAGLYGDHVETLLLGDSHFQIRPRKGQFVVFDKAAAKLLRSIILPVPNERTKGVVLTRTAFGNLLVGPTAEDQEDREQAALDQESLKSLIEAAVARLPGVKGIPVTALYAGLRPASEQKAYCVREETDRHFMTLGGVRSTGLTAALGLASHAYERYRTRHTHTPVTTPVWPWMPNIAEHRERDWQKKGYEEIVCHCELVTRREIDAAFDSPLPPGDIGGLKRRTRACMGRCQGFYCGGRVAELTQNRFATPLTTGHCHE